MPARVAMMSLGQVSVGREGIGRGEGMGVVDWRGPKEGGKERKNLLCAFVCHRLFVWGRRRRRGGGICRDLGDPVSNLGLGGLRLGVGSRDALGRRWRLGRRDHTESILLLLLLLALGFLLATHSHKKDFPPQPILETWNTQFPPPPSPIHLSEERRRKRDLRLLLLLLLGSSLRKLLQAPRQDAPRRQRVPADDQRLLPGPAGEQAVALAQLARDVLGDDGADLVAGVGAEEGALFELLEGLFWFVL